MVKVLFWPMLSWTFGPPALPAPSPSWSFEVPDPHLGLKGPTEPENGRSNNGGGGGVPPAGCPPLWGVQPLGADSSVKLNPLFAALTGRATLDTQIDLIQPLHGFVPPGAFGFRVIVATELVDPGHA
jgi:hypothetical protein